MKSTRNKWIVALCWLTVVFEGFDIVALSASIPQLLDTAHAGMTALDATDVTQRSDSGSTFFDSMINSVGTRS